jgi:hypothetical protein
MLSRPGRVVENAFAILSQKFQIYQWTPQSLPQNAGSIIFATCILHNYLRDQSVDISDVEVLQMIKAISRKYQNKEAVTTEVEVRDKFKQIFNISWK